MKLCKLPYNTNWHGDCAQGDRAPASRSSVGMHAMYMVFTHTPVCCFAPCRSHPRRSWSHLLFEAAYVAAVLVAVGHEAGLQHSESVRHGLYTLRTCTGLFEKLARVRVLVLCALYVDSGTTRVAFFT